jgi:acetylornithine deacetylase/succinyl-diaminopimelate desuccinylase-like protein
MKAGVTASLFAWKYLREFESELAGKATLTLVCDEETFGQYGARHLVRNCPEVLGDALIDGEPSDPGIIRVGDKGLVWAEVTFRTRGGHTGPMPMMKWRKGLFAFLRRNASSATDFFRIPPNRVVELGARIEF